MRYLILIAVLLCTACATTVAPKKTSDGISVIGEGKTFDEAKKNAFQKAIEQEVGVVLVTNTKIQNNKIAKDEILSHSAGYVQDYKVINTEKINDTYFVTMEVYVESSAIAKRVMGLMQDNRYEFDGQKLQDVITSHNEKQKSADALLNSILSDYPVSAYYIENPKVTKSDVEVYTDKDGRINFTIYGVVKYNYNYVKSVIEALKQASDERIPGYTENTVQENITIHSMPPNSWRDTIGFRKADVFWFNEPARAEAIKKQFDVDLYIKLNILDVNGKMIGYKCEPIIKQAGYSIYKNNPWLWEAYGEYRSEVSFYLNINDPMIPKIHSFELTLEKGQEPSTPWKVVPKEKNHC